MDWSIIRKAGSIAFADSLIDGPGIRNARKFLHNVSRIFAKSCVDYYNVTGELPFIYKERQVHSILFPAIAKIADAAFMEQPVTRKSKETNGYGWLDYWVSYGTTVFLIELKHSWQAAKSQAITKVAQESWQVALEQLERITSEEANSLAFNSDNVVKIALMVVPVYESSGQKENLKSYNREETIDIHSTILTGLQPKPNWSCSWLLHEDLQQPFNLHDERYEIFPCLSLVALVQSLRR